MESDAEMAERHGRLLARFAEQAASLAEDLHAAALAAETIEEKLSLSLAFHRTGRALRQTLALEARMRRDLARAERDAETALHEREDRARDAAKAAVRRRRDQLQDFVERLIDHETDDREDEAELQAQLEDALVQLAFEDDFTGQDFAEQVMRLCVALGLKPPPEFAEPDGDLPEHRSSA